MRSMALFFACLIAAMALPGMTANSAPVRVILWFDTEDYILPADDDACKRLAEMLTERGIRATFKVVGEKARELESRGRQDTITALRKHDIAYHANFHSVHPTPSEYLADCGFADGIEEFIRREGGGADDVRRIFSVDTLGCYGQPGSSWAPQAIGALKRIHVAPRGTPCYVDEGDHVGLDQRPFWYIGALNVYRMGQNCTRMDLHDPGALQPANEKVSAIVERLRNQGGGLISIYYHPCEWVHREFWDGVNFSRGANPPREQWKVPAQRSAQETDSAFARFGEYIDHIRRLPDVRFVTASDLPLLYPDGVRSTGVSREELSELASRIIAGRDSGLDFQVLGNNAYSVADQFELLATAVGRVAANQEVSFPWRAKGLFGPDAPPPSSASHELKWPAFRETVRDVVDFIQSRERVPARVFIGADSVPPADFLVALARVWTFHQEHGRLPVEDAIELGTNVSVLTSRRVAEDTPGLFGGWVIHKESFRAPKLLELARLQTWTLKPALQKH